MKTSSNLLINESPLVLLPTLAVNVGVDEAIFLQQLHYWISNQRVSGTTIDGAKWIRNSLPEWSEGFPFWSPRTLRRVIDNVRSDGIVLARSDLNSNKEDRTLAYTIDYEALDTITEPVQRLVKGERSGGKADVCGDHAEDQTQLSKMDNCYPSVQNGQLPTATHLSILDTSSYYIKDYQGSIDYSDEKPQQPTLFAEQQKPVQNQEVGTKTKKPTKRKNATEETIYDKILSQLCEIAPGIAYSPPRKSLDTIQNLMRGYANGRKVISVSSDDILALARLMSEDEFWGMNTTLDNISKRIHAWIRAGRPQKLGRPSQPQSYISQDWVANIPSD